MSGNRGFSLTEMLVGVAIFGIIAAVTVPNVRSYRESQRMSAASDRVATAVRGAQARARSMNQNVVLECRTNTNELAVIDDENGNGIFDAGEQVTVSPIPSGVALASTTVPGDRLVFNGRGRLVNGGNIVLDGTNVSSRLVRVSTGTGQVRVMTDS